MGLRYVSSFKSIQDDAFTVRIYDTSYSGEALTPRLKSDGIDLSEDTPEKATYPIVASSASISFVDNGEFDSFSVTDIMQCKVEVLRDDGKTVWSGYICPETYDMTIFTRPSVVRFTADSAAAIMSRKKITTGDDMPTFAALLGECFDACGFPEDKVLFQVVAEPSYSYPVTFPTGMWGIRASRSLWVRPEINDVDDTEERTTYDCDTWDVVVGDILRYYGLHLSESFEDGEIRLTGPWPYTAEDLAFTIMSRDDFKAAGGAIDFKQCAITALDSLESGGTDNRMSVMTIYKGAKVSADISSVQSPAMQQSENQRTIIIDQNADIYMPAKYTPQTVFNIMSGRVRNAGADESMYYVEDLKSHVFTVDGNNAIDEIVNLANEMSVIWEDYTTPNGTPCKNLLLAGALPIKSVWGRENALDERKTTGEYIETQILRNVAYSQKKADGSRNYAYLNGGVWLTHWQRNDVTLIGEFAWSIYFRVFTDNHVSMDTVPCPGNGVEAFFWWDDTGGVRHWWNGSGWQTTEAHFLPNYENTESYPSSTIKTEYPNGTEYVGLKGTIMEHVANDLPVSAFGGGIAVRDAWRDFRDGTGETATRVETLYLRDFEIGIGSDRLKYGLDPYTGEPKSSYNYINRNSVNGTDELVEEEFPFHTWSSSPLSGSSLIIGTDNAYDYVAEFGGKKYDSDKRHEEALAEHLSAYYGKPRRRYTLEVHGNPAHHVIYTYKGKRYMELSRVFMPMADMTRLTVEEIMSND